jgi:hypothetical protein
LQAFFVVFAYAAEEFEGETEEGDADAGDGEHGFCSDVPCGGEEASVYCVPVPDHLENCVSN